jgi:hypothetical protein
MAFLINAPHLPGHWADDPTVDAVVVMVMAGLTPGEVATMWGSLAEGPPITERPTTLDGRPAQEVVFDTTVGGAVRRVRLVGVAAGETSYTVIHSAGVERYDAQVSLVSTALDTFELLPGPGGSGHLMQMVGRWHLRRNRAENSRFSAEGRRLLLTDVHGEPVTGEYDPKSGDESDARIVVFMRRMDAAGFELLRRNGAVDQVIESGLPIPDDKRLPALRRLLVDGASQEQFYACKMLVSWGDPTGFKTLRAWIRDPAAAPWEARDVHQSRDLEWEPVADSGFSGLAEAVANSRRLDRLDLNADRQDALGALLGLAGQYEVAQGVAFSLTADHALTGAVSRELAEAVDRCLLVVEAGQRSRFDVALETALLIGSLAEVDDDHAAAAARRLMVACNNSPRPLTTLAIHLGYTSGPKIKNVLEELSGHSAPEVAKYARLSLANHRDPSRRPRSDRSKTASGGRWRRCRGAPDEQEPGPEAGEIEVGKF